MDIETVFSIKLREKLILDRRSFRLVQALRHVLHQLLSLVQKVFLTTFTLALFSSANRGYQLVTMEFHSSWIVVPMLVLLNSHVIQHLSVKLIRLKQNGDDATHNS